MNLCSGCYAEDVKLYPITMPTGRSPAFVQIAVCAGCVGKFINMQREAVMQTIKDEPAVVATHSNGE